MTSTVTFASFFGLIGGGLAHLVVKYREHHRRRYHNRVPIRRAATSIHAYAVGLMRLQRDVNAINQV